MAFINAVKYSGSFPKDNDKLGKSYFFDKGIAKNQDEYERIRVDENIKVKIRELINEDKQAKSDLFKSIFGDSDAAIRISAKFTENYKQIERMLDGEEATKRPIYRSLKYPAFIMQNSEDTFVIFAKEESVSKKAYGEIKEKFNQINEYSSDFGVNLKKMYDGKEYVKELVSARENVKEIKELNVKSGQEVLVVDSVKQVTNNYFSNIDVVFENPKENFEFDCILTFGNGTILDIEAKDFTNVKDELIEENLKDTVKNRLILAPSDKAKRLDSQLLIVVDGVQEKQLNFMKQFASSRKIELLTNDEFQKDIERRILDLSLGDIASPYSSLFGTYLSSISSRLRGSIFTE